MGVTLEWDCHPQALKSESPTPLLFSVKVHYQNYNRNNLGDRYSGDRYSGDRFFYRVR